MNWWFCVLFFLKVVQSKLSDLSFFFLKSFIAQWKRLVYVAVLCYLCMFLYRFGWLWLVLVVACFVTYAIYSRWVKPWCIMLVSCNMCIIYIYIYIYMLLSFFFSTLVEWWSIKSVVLLLLRWLCLLSYTKSIEN